MVQRSGGKKERERLNTLWMDQKPSMSQLRLACGLRGPLGNPNHHSPACVPCACPGKKAWGSTSLQFLQLSCVVKV